MRWSKINIYIKWSLQISPHINDPNLKNTRKLEFYNKQSWKVRLSWFTSRFRYPNLTHMLPQYLCFLLIYTILQDQNIQTYSGTWVYRLDLLYDFGEDSYICICVGKVAVVILVTQCKICKWKQTFAKCCLQTKLFAKRSISTLIISPYYQQNTMSRPYF